jgi:outer membrane protein assembly factor BamB
MCTQPDPALFANLSNGDDSRRSAFTLHDARRQTVLISHGSRGGLGVAAVLVALLFAEVCFAQSAPSSIRPLRTAPTEKFAVNARVRDWGPATVAGKTILAGSPSGEAGLFAIDMLSGKLKWSYRPGNKNASVSTPPAVYRDIVIAPFGAANPGVVVGVSITTGKEIWRGPDPAVGAAVAVYESFAYIQSKDGSFYALDAATGNLIWKVAFSNKRAPCASRPIVQDGTIYLTSSADPIAGDTTKPAGYFLFALDAKTGQERWRYRAEAPYVNAGVCLQQPVVTNDTIFATGENRLYAVDLSNGRDRWQPIEVRRPVDGRERPVEVHGLVDAGSVLIGLTNGFLIAFDKANGQTAWEIAGAYAESHPSTAVAGNVLYFQGSPSSKPAVASRGTLHALDLNTRTILWSFSRPTAEPNWAFGTVTPVDDGLWVDSYQALVKLQ